jgi:hypothetical protein
MRIEALVAKTRLAQADGQAIEDAACLVFLEREIVGFAASHGDYTPEECAALQAVADTSRGGRGTNLILPKGRNVAMDMLNPLGHIGATNEQYYTPDGQPIEMRMPPQPGGAVMFSKGRQPVDTTFRNENIVAQFLPLIQSLLRQAPAPVAAKAGAKVGR